MPQIIEVNGTEYEFPDGMSDDAIRAVLGRETSMPNRRQWEGLPMDQVPQYRDASFIENAKARGANMLTQLPAAIAQGISAPLDLMAMRNPAVAAERSASGNYMPLTESIGSMQRDAAGAMTRAAGVPREAMTDVAGAQGQIMGDVAAAPAMRAAANGPRVVAGEARRVATVLSEKVAPQIMRGRNMLNPKNAQMRFGADPGEFTVGMKTKAGGGVGSLGPQIDQKLATLETKADHIAMNTLEGRKNVIDYEGPIRESFTRAIEAAHLDGNGTLASRLGGVMKQELRQLYKATNDHGKATAAFGRRYHQGLGERVRKFSPDPAEGTIRTARQEAWEQIKENTDNAVPGLKPVNSQIHSGIEASKAAQEAALTASKSDTLRGAVANAFSGPYVRSRVASGLRSLAPKVEAKMPDLLPPMSSDVDIAARVAAKQRFGRPSLPAAPTQRALPPAPEGSTGGFISSDDLRRVGTRIGASETDDAGVFVAKNTTEGMTPPALLPNLRRDDFSAFLQRLTEAQKVSLFEELMAGDTVMNLMRKYR